MKAKPTPIVMPNRMAITGIRALKKSEAIPNRLARKVVISRDIIFTSSPLIFQIYYWIQDINLQLGIVWQATDKP
jgi:hypothetical protein